MQTAPVAFQPKKHPAVLATVVVVHVALAYAVLQAMGVRVVPVKPPVVQTQVLVDVVKEVEPPPPPVVKPKTDFKIDLPQELVPVVPTPQQNEPTISTQREAVPDRPAELSHPATQEVAPTRPLPVARAPVIDVSQCARPEYPAAALRADATGVTRVAFVVDAAGRVAGAQVVRSAGGTREHKLLDGAAVEALSQCPFKPGADEAGRAVGGNAHVEYTWTLN